VLLPNPSPNKEGHGGVMKKQVVMDLSTNQEVLILETIKSWNYTTHTVYNPATGQVYKLPEEAVSLTQPKTDINLDHLRYVAWLAKIKDEVSEGTLAKVSSEVIPLPHQLYALNRALSDQNIRYILADEVGLGKTIEAGLIIKELKARGLIRRTLVVCPTGLVTQWRAEMQDKFGETFRVILPKDFETIRNITDSQDVYGQFDQVISPMDAIKPLENRVGWTPEQITQYNQHRVHAVVNSGWDLIIIDEAHRVAGSTGEVARHKLGKMLASASPYLLLLTATPHNGKTKPFLRLIRLVDEKAFPHEAAVVKEQVAPYVIRSEKREAIDNEGKKLFKNRNTQAISLTWGPQHSMQKELYMQVTDYVSKTYNKALRNRGKNMWVIFLLIIMQRMVTSSTRAIKESLLRRVDVLKQEDLSLGNLSQTDSLEMELEEGMDQAMYSISLDIQEEIEALESIISLAQQAEYQYPDVKIEPLRTLLENITAQEKDRKVIVFTEFVATQSFLAEQLTNWGYKVSILNGRMDMQERNDVLTDFRKESQILVSTDAGGEGLNLQFASCVINYDLPWNPMKIEQRIGRVDRIGQYRDVDVYNFLLEDTVESRVRRVLEEKLSVILKEIGVDKYADVLDGETAAVNFTNAYMNTIRNERRLDRNIKPIEEDIRTQVENSIKVRSLIHEEKDLSALVGAQSGIDVSSALALMMRHYRNSKGDVELLAQSYSLTDPVISEHLRRDIRQEAHDAVPSIGLEGLSTEQGIFMLWRLSVTADESHSKTVPLFFNEEGIYRPFAAKRIWEALLDPYQKIMFEVHPPLSEDLFAKLVAQAEEQAKGMFLDMKAEHLKRQEERFRKYSYALELRTQAAHRIGIENIKKHRLATLLAEKETMEKEHEINMRVCPSFRLEMLLRVEPS
jgi:superfamily II DNA/RNA helicase